MDELSLAAGIILGAGTVSAFWFACHRMSPIRVIFDPFFRPTQKLRVVDQSESPGYQAEAFIDDFIDSVEQDSDEGGCFGYHMSRDDWKPLIDAMEHLSNLPQCGDVARRLLAIFKAARVGKYYFIEMGYEGQNGRCYIVSQEFAVDKTGKDKVK